MQGDGPGPIFLWDGQPHPGGDRLILHQPLREPIVAVLGAGGQPSLDDGGPDGPGLVEQQSPA